MDDTGTKDFMSYDRRLSRLRAELAARDAEILRLKKRVNGLINEVTRLILQP